jgi:hypothetical protein
MAQIVLRKPGKTAVIAAVSYNESSDKGYRS